MNEENTEQTEGNDLESLDSELQAESSEDQAMQADSDEAMQADSDEAMQADSDGAMQADSDEAMQADSDEAMQADSDEAMQADSDEAMQADSDEAMQADSDEAMQADDSETSSPEEPRDEFYEQCDLSLKSQIEAILFAAPKCMRAEDIFPLLLLEIEDLDKVQSLCLELKEEYEARDGGFRLETVRGHGYQFRTVTNAAPLMKRMFASRPRPLSRAALETLAIIAYRQPCTRAEIEFVRGVDAGNMIRHLIERTLIACVGRKEEAGRPMIFGTTNEFLQTFALSNIKDIPPLTAFQTASELVSSESEISTMALEEAPDVGGDFMAGNENESPEASTGILDNSIPASPETQEDAAMPQEDHNSTCSEPSDIDTAEQTALPELTASIDHCESVASISENKAPSENLPEKDLHTETETPRTVQGATFAEDEDDEEFTASFSDDIDSPEQASSNEGDRVEASDRPVDQKS
jgi:segregation and condensation protein B